MKRTFAAVTFTLVSLITAGARADVADRSGFTLELGIGLAQTHIEPDGGESRGELGLAPLSISLGGFVSDRFAVMGRAAGTSYFKDAGDETLQFTSGFYGLVGEYWFNDRVFTSAGVGLATFGLNPLTSAKDYDPETGLGFALRGGYSFFTSEDHSLRASLELFPSFFDDATTVGTAATFEWQLF
jgi:hypothetical protein